jgi:lambda family phage portal protein
VARTVRLGNRALNVRWTLSDRVTEWWNPKAGLERLRSRAIMASVGGYEGGKRDRRSTRNWRPRQTSANEDISPDLPDLRSRSRDLVRNVPIATGAIQTVVNNVVGDGLVLQSQIDREVLGLSDEQAEAWQAAAQREFLIWGKNPDFSGRLNWDEYQALVFRSVLESGDIFIARRRRKGPRDTYALKLLAIEADRVSNPSFSANKINLVDGVEMDADGVPVAYHISSSHPDDTTQGKKREWKRYELGSTVTGQPLILHLFSQLRPDQARGIPYLAPVIEAIKQIGDYSEAEIKAAVISAFFTVFVKQPVVASDGDAASILGDDPAYANADPSTEVQMGSGAIVDLAPGEEPVFADPKRPNTAFEPFMDAVTKSIGAALGIPKELLLKAFSASYSASRAALEMAWQFFNERRVWFAWKFCQPVYEWVITEAVVQGRLAAPGFFNDPVIREAWLGSIWVSTASFISLDPAKEANAYKTHLEMGTTNRQRIAMELNGSDWSLVHKQLAKEEEQRRVDNVGQQPASDTPAPADAEEPDNAKSKDAEE